MVLCGCVSVSVSLSFSLSLSLGYAVMFFYFFKNGRYCNVTGEYFYLLKKRQILWCIWWVNLFRIILSGQVINRLAILSRAVTEGGWSGRLEVPENAPTAATRAVVVVSVLVCATLRA